MACMLEKRNIALERENTSFTTPLFLTHTEDRMHIFFLSIDSPHTKKKSLRDANEKHAAYVKERVFVLLFVPIERKTPSKNGTRILYHWEKEKTSIILKEKIFFSRVLP